MLRRAFEEGAHRAWRESERLSFVLALGEAARGDPAVRASLLARLRERSSDRFLTIAAAKAGGAEVAALLRPRFLKLARWSEASRDELRELGRCLHAADPRAPLAAIWELEGEDRRRAAMAIGLELGAPPLLADLDRADGPGRRIAAFRDLDRLIGATCGGDFPRARDATRLVRWLASLLDETEGPLRHRVLAAAEELLYAFNRYPIRSGSSSGDESRSVTGASIGPYPDIETVLRALVDDLAAGRLVFMDGDGDLLSPRPHEVPEDAVRATAAWEDAGLRVTVVNVGETTILVNPVAARYGTGHVTDVVIEKGGERSEHRELGINMGFVRADVGIAASALVPVEPGRSCSWIQPVRAEDRAAAHVAYGVRSMPIVGHARLPVLTEVSATLER
jgi:hypothetical protein